MVIYNWMGTINDQLTQEYKSGNARKLKYICLHGVMWSGMQVPMCMSPVLRMKIRNKPNWKTAETIELDFKKHEVRTVKIFLDALYGCGEEDLDTEDLVKLVRLVDEHGSQQMLASVVDTFVLADMSPVERIDLGMCLIQYDDAKIASLRSACFEGFGITKIVRKRAENVSENDLVFRTTKLAMRNGEGQILTNEEVKNRIHQIAKHVAGAIPKRLVRFGGEDEDEEEIDSVSYLEEGATAEEWKTADLKMKEGRWGHAVVRIESDVFIVGGSDGHQWLRSVHKLDLTTLTWTECTPMNKARRCLIGCLFESGGKKFILAAGGVNAEEGELSSSEIFDVAKQTWENGPAMEEKRNDACSVNVDQNVWVIGGRNGRGHLKTCEIFSSGTKTWTAGPELKEERYAAGAVVAKENIYVAGGYRTRTVEFIPKDGGEWTVMKPTMNVERVGFGLAWFNEGLLAVGGYTRGGRSSTEWLEDANPEGEWEEHIPLEGCTAFFGDLAIL